jgi:hypothetical protein
MTYLSERTGSVSFNKELKKCDIFRCVIYDKNSFFFRIIRRCHFIPILFNYIEFSNNWLQNIHGIFQLVISN